MAPIRIVNGIGITSVIDPSHSRTDYAIPAVESSQLSGRVRASNPAVLGSSLTSAKIEPNTIFYRVRKDIQCSNNIRRKRSKKTPVRDAYTRPTNKIPPHPESAPGRGL